MTARTVVASCLLSVAATAFAAGEPAAPSAPVTAPPAAITAPARGHAMPEDNRTALNEINRLLRDAKHQRELGNLDAARTMTLEAAKKLRASGFERDQVSVLRDMTLDPDPGFSKAGSQAMADYYYQKYIRSKPRDAQWLLEALAWVHYSGDDSQLKRFTARLPDKAHENIDARGKQRGDELKADDQLYLASEMIRLNQVEELRQLLKNWPYPIDRIHSVAGTSLLHSAVWHRKTGIARMLVEEYRASVNVVDLQNDTPLDYANYRQATDLVQYLKSKGGKANKRYTGQQGQDGAAVQGKAIGKRQPTLEQLQQINPDALKLPPGAQGPAPAPSQTTTPTPTPAPAPAPAPDKTAP